MDDDQNKSYFGKDEIGKAKSTGSSDNVAQALRHGDESAVVNASKSGRISGGDSQMQARSSESGGWSVSGALAKESKGRYDDRQNTKSATRTMNARYGAKGWRKFGPIGLLVALMVGGGGAMLGLQSLAPFSLVAQFQEKFDSIKTVHELRSNVFVKAQMNPNRVKDPIRGKLFWGTDTFKIRTNQRNKLSAQGITVVDNFEGTNVTVMRFDDGTGTPKIIVPDSNLEARFEGSISYDRAMTESSDFRNGYIKGSRTWRGAVGFWFSSMTVRFLQSNRLTRNLFKDWQRRVEAEAAGNQKSQKEILSSAMMENKVETNEIRANSSDEGQTTDADGNTKPIEESSTNSFSMKGLINKAESKIKNIDAIRAKLNESGNKMKKSASSLIGSGVNIVCTVFNFIGTISLMVAAHQIAQLLTLATSMGEAVQKVQSGEATADDSPINTLMGQWFEPAVTYAPDELANLKDVDDNTLIEGQPLRTRSAAESNAVMSLYGGGAINQKDPSVKNFSLSDTFNNVLGAIGVSAVSFLTCAAARIGAAMASAVIDTISIIGCIVSLGLGCLAKAGLDVLAGIGTSLGIAFIIGTVAKMLAPVLFTIFAKNILESLVGEDLGNATFSGFHNMMSRNAQGAGQSPLNEEKYLAFYQAQQEVIANQARFDRETMSPFDMSSKYTFMGSLATSMMPVASSMRSFSGVFTNIGRTVGSAFSALLPTASALNTLEAKQSIGDCPDLESVGAVGDAFCNPYIGSDLGTIEIDPADVINNVYNLNRQNFMDSDADDGAPRIAKNSPLAKYVIYCGQRQSPFGITDQNFANELSSPLNVNTSSDVFNTTSNTIVHAIPVIGDVFSIANDSNGIANFGFITGESCVAGNTVSGAFASSPDWNEARQYQRFIEDSSLMEVMDPEYKSPVSVFLDEYYLEHPLDNSYEGVLARYSGLTKETVIATFDQLKEYQFLANYNPIGYGPVEWYYAPTLQELLPENIVIADNGHQAPISPVELFMLSRREGIITV